MGVASKLYNYIRLIALPPKVNGQEIQIVLKIRIAKYSQPNEKVVQITNNGNTNQNNPDISLLEWLWKGKHTNIFWWNCKMAQPFWKVI